MDLTKFLLARIAEDERRWGNPAFLRVSGPDLSGMVLWVRAECEAKRRIVERYATCLAENERNTADHEAFVAAGGSEFDEPDPTLYEPIDRTRTTSAFETVGLAFACQSLGTAYADHPDYRDEWRP